MDEPPPQPRIEYVKYARLAIMAHLPKVHLKVADDTLYRLYQYWLHQNPENNLDGGIKDYGKW